MHGTFLRGSAEGDLAQNVLGAVGLLLARNSALSAADEQRADLRSIYLIENGLEGRKSVIGEPIGGQRSRRKRLRGDAGRNRRPIRR